jgi:hypothetical protein
MKVKFNIHEFIEENASTYNGQLRVSADIDLDDVLADARHWCDLNGQCFGELDRRAYQQYLAEIHNNRRSHT